MGRRGLFIGGRWVFNYLDGEGFRTLPRLYRHGEVGCTRAYRSQINLPREIFRMILGDATLGMLRR